MEITQEPEPSLLKKILGFLFFFLFSLSTLVWWVWELMHLYQQVSSSSDVITLQKGALYMFGCSVLGGLLTYGVFLETILKRPHTEKFSNKANKWINRGFSFGLISLFLFPLVIRLPLEEYLDKKDYLICEMDSVQWSMYRKIVYTSSLEVCDEAIKIEKERIEQLISSPLF